MIADMVFTNWIFNMELDEIVSIEYIGERETVDINTAGNRLFYANGILTHNSAVEEIEFDHSHISGGISKINTADNVFGIFTSRSMRERGQYQIQLMKTRSSSGVGQKIELAFDLETLRITDPDPDGYNSAPKPSPSDIMSKIKAVSQIESPTINTDVEPVNKTVHVDVQSAKLKSLLNSLKK